MTQLEKLQDIIDRSGNIVFFGGAGVSTASGIPDFRSQDGLFNQKYPYPPEQIVSHSFYKSHPEVFFAFLREKMIFRDAKPNAVHRKLAELEQAGKLCAVITQNIDGLHQKAGSKKVYELHGSISRNYCESCGMKYGMERLTDAPGIPLCACGGTVRPDVVLYEEQLDDQIVREAIGHIGKADTLIVGGTSLAVYPAAGFLNYFRGDNLVIINKSPTSRDEAADLVMAGDIVGILEQIRA